MVAGKLSILLATSTSWASDINNPRFFEYQTGPFINQLAAFSFGWFKTLKDDQAEAYQQSLIHAVKVAENGKSVSWYRGDASGYAVPVYTWPTGSGYCRRIYIEAIAYNTKKNIEATACYENSSDKWQWVSTK